MFECRTSDLFHVCLLASGQAVVTGVAPSASTLGTYLHFHRAEDSLYADFHQKLANSRSRAFHKSKYVQRYNYHWLFGLLAPYTLFTDQCRRKNGKSSSSGMVREPGRHLGPGSVQRGVQDCGPHSCEFRLHTETSATIEVLQHVLIENKF